jgi:hypothetical protein
MAEVIHGAERLGTEVLFLAHRKELIDQTSAPSSTRSASTTASSCRATSAHALAARPGREVQTLAAGAAEPACARPRHHRRGAPRAREDVRSDPRRVPERAGRRRDRDALAHRRPRPRRAVPGPGRRRAAARAHRPGPPGAVHRLRLRLPGRERGEEARLGLRAGRPRARHGRAQARRQHRRAVASEHARARDHRLRGQRRAQQGSRERFVDAGVAAEHLDGETPGPQRDAILRRLAAGATRVLCNVGVLTEGWDCPAAEVCVLARPTLSAGLYLQMVGRVMRPSPATGKTVARIHDHAGCIIEHGAPDVDRDYALDGDERAPERRRPPPLGPARNCFAHLRARWSARACPPAAASTSRAREIREVDGPVVRARSRSPSCRSSSRRPTPRSASTSSGCSAPRRRRAIAPAQRR